MHPLNWVIVIGWLSYVVIYGIWRSKGTKDIEGYLLANRSAETAHAAHSAAQEAYDRRMAELSVGEVTTADVFASENELNAARLQVLDAAVDRHLARARLAYALGE